MTARTQHTEFTRRRIVTGGLATGIAGIATAVSAEPAREEPRLRERAKMARAARAFLKRYQMPGLSVAIGRNGRIVYASGFGVADKRTGEAVTPENLFRVASVSKPITAVAIFKLIEEGRLRLDDKVFGPGGVLDSEFPNAKGFVKEITVEHLLSHTMGGWAGKDDPLFMHREMNQTQLISWVLDNVPLPGAPGHKFGYSNFGYVLLGRIIEKVSKQGYEEYVRDAILVPCGITDMRIAGNRLAKRAPMEVVYYSGMAGPYDPYIIQGQRGDSNGGWIATPTDLLHFIMHVDGSEQPSILRAETVRTMATPSTASPHYAKGWVVYEGDWEHSGALPGTTAIMVRGRDGMCWAGVTNSDSKDSNAGLDKLLRTMVQSVRGWTA